MIRTCSVVALALLATGCPKKDGAGADAAASASASASAAPTAEAAKPNPPADADKSCTPTPTKIEQDKEGIAIDYNVKNTGTQPWHYCHVNAFGYDKSGKLVARGMLSDNISLAPGAGHDTSLHVTNADNGKPLDMATALTLSYELLPGRIIWDDKSEWENKNGGFDHKAANGPTISFNKDGSPVGGAAKGAASAAASAGKPATTAAAKGSAGPAKTPPGKH